MKYISVIAVLLFIMVGCANGNTDSGLEESAQISKVYEVILKDIHDVLLKNQTANDVESAYFSTGIFEAVISCETVDERMKAIVYCIMDVNRDGIEELLIIDTTYPEPGNVRILDMYTIVEETPVKVIEGWTRNRYFLLDDGMIYNSASSGACYTNNELFIFEAGATELTSKELYFTYPKDGDTCGYYHSENSVYDVAEAVEISKEEFQAFTDGCENRIVQFEGSTFEGIEK